jgi:hypothetical protein
MMNQASDNQVANRKRGFAQVLWNAKGALAIALLAIVLPACNNNQQAGAPLTQEQENVTAEDVTENTESLVGQTVTIRSEAEAVGENAFTVSDGQFLSGETILVVNATGQPFAVPTDGIAIQATGEVRQFTIAELEEEYNLSGDRELYAEYENKPAIIAQSLAIAPEPEEITENPSEFYGETVAVRGEVEEVGESGVFRLDGGDLIVFVPTQQRAITEDQAIAAVGEVRPFVVAEFERDYDLTWDAGVQSQLEAEYANKPVLIADSVFPSAIPEVAK